MSDLKLGPLPKQESFKLTLILSKQLRDALDLYVSDYVSIHGPAELQDLAPHMLEAFIRSDKAFMKRHTESIRANAASIPQPLPSSSNLGAEGNVARKRRSQPTEDTAATS